MTTTPTPRDHPADDVRGAGRSPRRIVLLAVVAVAVVVSGVFGAHTIALAVAPAVPTPAGAVDDGSAAMRYRGSWTTRASSGYIGKTDHLSAATDASVSYRFSGSQVALYGGVGPGSGIAAVSVDRGPAYEVDFYSPKPAGAQLLWASSPLTGGTHRITIRVTGEHRDDSTGATVDLDALRVLRSGRSQSAATASGLKFSSGWTTTGTARAGSVGTMTMRFTGAAAVISGSIGSGSGSVRVDGGAAQPLLPGAGRLWSSGALRGGGHLITLSFTGRAEVTSTTVVDAVLDVPQPTGGMRTSGGWRTFTGNPVVGKNWGTAFDLSAMHQNGLYRVWFSWRPKAAIAYVQSVDGVSWTAPRIVLAARAGTWESDVNRPSVIVGPSGSYEMWYTGQNSGASALGHAVSADGIHWTRPQSTPVLTAQGWEQPSVMNASVIWDAAMHRYRMWYSGGQTEEPNAIGYATSANGVDWSRYAATPVFAADPAHTWEQNRVAGVQVIEQAPDRYLAFYIGYRDILTAAIGVARSNDGIHWSHELTKPLIAAVPKTWDCDAVYKPFALWDATDDEWRLWFNGRCGGDEQLGMAMHRGAALF